MWPTCGSSVLRRDWGVGPLILYRVHCCVLLWSKEYLVRTISCRKIACIAGDHPPRCRCDHACPLTPHLTSNAWKGEKIEDEIIEIATVLREKADAMVAKTGSIDFEVIQPMMDEISVLKNRYK